MAGFNSQTGLLNRALQLLDAVGANADQLQGSVEPLRARLEQAVAQLRAEITSRDTFKAEKQVRSRRLKETAQVVNDLYIDLKSQLKATLGSRSEKVTEFGIKPRRKVLRADRPSSSPKARRRAVLPPELPDVPATPESREAPGS